MAQAKKIKVKVYHRGTCDLPVVQTNGSAAVDLYAEVGMDVLLLNGQTQLIPTGLHVEIPKGYCFKVYSRSGLAHKEGVSIANGVGVIDSDYRGQIFVSLTNRSNTARWIKKGQRIAQMMLEKVEVWEWDTVKELEGLSSTDRGAGGFGSTTKKDI